jgi:hypothetical protein
LLLIYTSGVGAAYERTMKKGGDKYLDVPGHFFVFMYVATVWVDSSMGFHFIFNNG